MSLSPAPLTYAEYYPPPRPCPHTLFLLTYAMLSQSGGLALPQEQTYGTPEVRGVDHKCPS